MFIRGSVFILCTLVILFIYSPVLTGVTMSGIVPVLVFGAIYGGRMKVLTKQLQEDKAKMSNVADESFGNIRTVKAFSNELEETAKFDKHNCDVFAVAKVRAVWYGFFVFAV
jgi:ATP-binding cassette, subfamily B, bacterial